jgi:uncharacterized Fe-S cluster protein YjdI
LNITRREPTMSETTEPGLHEYHTDAITVEWRPARCIHSARCVAGLPAVFDPKRRPWIELGDTPADALATVIHQCPSGALRYVRRDAGPPESADVPVTVTPTPGGPYYLRGDVVVNDLAGNPIRHEGRVALCACGKSRAAPFCDLACRAPA